METGLDLSPIPVEKRTASLGDVAILFAGANIVTTTLVTGGALVPGHSFREALLIIGLGVLIGTLPIAALARLGPRFGLPSMVVLRHPFGHYGAALISILLVITNFAWIALNNVIAAEALQTLAPGPGWGWNLLVGAAAVAVALVGPRAMILFDRVAIPMMLIVGAGLTWALFGPAGRDALASATGVGAGILVGLDTVVGYQVSWSLMFADYTRFQREERRASQAVFLGMMISSVWLMAVGAGAAVAGGGSSPTDMILGLGLPMGALLLMALSAITTNFVNIYLSSLALKNLAPAIPPRFTIFAIGAVGTLLGLVSPRLLDRYAGFMGWVATLLLPIVAITILHFLRRVSDPRDAPQLRWPSLIAWLVGVLTYQGIGRFAPDWGSTLPTLLATALVYALLSAGAESGESGAERRIS